MMIGTMQSGTTYLWKALLRHPNMQHVIIDPSEPKWAEREVSGTRVD